MNAIVLAVLIAGFSYAGESPMDSTVKPEELTDKAHSEEASDKQEPRAPEHAPKHSMEKEYVKSRKGKVAREKEAEGTQAPNRFDADIILKSKYELNGQSLEVDPD